MNKHVTIKKTSMCFILEDSWISNDSNSLAIWNKFNRREAVNSEETSF